MTTPMQPPPGSPYSPAPRPRKGKGMIIAGIILMALAVISVIIGVTAGVGSVKNFSQDMQPAVIPGESTIEIPEAGVYIIFHERDAANDAPLPADAAVEITGPGGEVAAVERITGNQTYQVNNRSGAAVWSFQVETPGRYTINATAAEGSEPARLAVGGNVMGMVGGVFGMVCSVIGGGLLGLIGLILLIVGLVRRSKSA